MTIYPWLIATTNLGLPVLLAALGGLVCEKSGTAALFLEGTMLTASFIAIRAGGGFTGLLCGLATGMLVTGIHYLLVHRANVKDVIAGVGLNMFALSVTSLCERISPSAESVPTLSTQTGTLIAASCVAAFIISYRTTNIRVQLEISGESALQAQIFGVNVSRVRMLSHLVAGGLAGLGGALLPIMGIGTFVENMTNGRGYLALAAIVFGRWEPHLVIATSIGFAGLDALQLVAAAQGVKIDADLLALLPYVAGLAALMFRTKRNSGPAELSKSA
ncbi:MAG: ABC transporter permease subunit [Armatimonadota bacterium]